ATGIFWGPDLILLYNDGCRRMIAGKHPAALGHPGREGWPEIWHIIGPRLQSVLDTGQATWSEDFPLLLERNGSLEECYFTFSLSPIRDETGKVGGIFTPATETTEKVIGERRLRTLRDLAARTAQAKEVAEASRIAVETLVTNPYDIPFALLYLLDDDRQRACLVGTAGLAPGTPASPHVVELGNLEEPPQGWPLAQVARTGQAEVMDALEQKFGALPGGAWPVAPQSAMVLPIMLPGQELPFGLLVAALSPRKAFNDDYRAFLALVAQQVATSMAKARAGEESGVESLEGGGGGLLDQAVQRPRAADPHGGAHLEMARLRQETARREQELRAEAEAARARVVSILESITDGFFAVDHQWQFTYINQKAEQLLQKRPDELLSKNVWEEFPEAVSSIFFEHCHKAASQRIAVEFEFEGFYPLLNIWFEVHAYPSPDGLLVYFHDITAHKWAEEALKESEERYRDLFENANDLIQSVGPDGHFVYVNRAWREALRYTEAEISHLSFLDILSPKSHAHCIDIFQGVMAGEKIDKVEAVFL
ncbi:MAG: PAS domain S-box protein, partial [Deltaproteobacteria bacterium]